MASTETEINANERRTSGPLTPDEEGALMNLDHCPICDTRCIFRRPWREDWYCGECRSVFKIVKRVIHYIGNQAYLK